MGWFSELLKPITDIIKVPLEGYEARKTLSLEMEAKDKERQHDINLKKLEIASELAKQGQQIESNWDTNAQIDARLSWKDEYLTILFSLPLIFAFFPATQQAVLKGFVILQQTPVWYLTLVGGIVASAFGLRWLISRGKDK